MITQVPELYDGGYWYAVPEIVDEDGSIRPDIEDGAGWCAWYDEQGGVLVRMPLLGTVPHHGVEVDLPKPYGRIGGR